ncbi:MAG: SBBP repeat-containing protein [Caldisericia bacterium]|nr:SBBP repeat-containing protein [Caldisericia bacterium]
MKKKVVAVFVCLFICLSLHRPISFAQTIHLNVVKQCKNQKVSSQHVILDKTKNINSTIDTTTAQSLLSSSQYFTENRGQWDPEILYMGNTSFGRVAFTANGICYEIKQEKYEEYIYLSFVKSNTPTIKGSDPLMHCNNYMFGYQETWAIGCKNHTTITYTNIWTGIDLSYSFTPEGLKYEYYLHPEANMQDLQVKVIGAILKEENTTLMLESINYNCVDSSATYTQFTLLDDELYTYTKDSKQELNSSFVINENNIYSFNIESLPEVRNETIVIDPVVYSTYIGGNNDDCGYSIAVDDQNCAYITGYTGSQDFPMTETVGGFNAPGYDQRFSGSGDAFVIKLNPQGTRLEYATFLGGSYPDIAYSIVLDSHGCAYVTGYTYSQDFPMAETVGGSNAPGYDQRFSGSSDAFVIKLNPQGTKLEYATFLGGSGFDCGNSLVLDSHGCAYVTGYTYSQDFPMTETVGGSNAPGYDQKYNDAIDAFLVKLNPQGTKLEYATFLGGSGFDCGNSLVLDSHGCAYVTGYTYSQDFPMTETVGGSNAPGYDQKYNDATDAFVIKLNPQGTKLEYATFLGGRGFDCGNSLVLDSNLSAYVTGYTYSKDFPMTETVGGSNAPGYDQKFNGSWDAFVIKLNPQGTKLEYATFLGGHLDDRGNSLVLDIHECAYVTGYTKSKDFPMTETVGGSNAPGYDKKFSGYNGGTDAFVIKLNPQGTKLEYATFLGGHLDDYGNSLVLDSHGCIYLTGSAGSQNFPMTETVGGSNAPGYDQKFNGSWDAFVIKLDVYKYFPEISYTLKQNKFSLTVGKSHSTTLDITNEGENSTLVGSVESNKEWINILNSSFSINEGQSNKIEIRISTSGLNHGTYNGSIVINSNDPDNSRISIDVNLEIVPEDSILWLDKHSFFKELVKGTSNNDYFTIQNKGKKSSLLSVDVSSNESWIKTDSNNITLKPNGKRNISFSLYTNRLSKNKTYHGSIILTSNDPDKPIVEIPVSLKVLPVELLISLQIGNRKAKKECTDGSINETVTLDTPPTIINGRTLVPLRFLAEAFGATLGWDAKAEEIQIRYNDMLIHLWLHRKYGRTYDALIERAGKTPEKISLTTPPCIINGRTMVPLRFISETFGAKLDWNGETQTITLTIEIK